MKVAIFIFGIVLMMSTCSQSLPKNSAIHKACAEPVSGEVILTGYVSIPIQLETTKFTNGDVVYRLYLNEKPGSSGTAIPIVLRGTKEPKRNMAGLLPAKYSDSDLVVYTDETRAVLPKDRVRITGRVVKKSPKECHINVIKVEGTEP